MQNTCEWKNIDDFFDDIKNHIANEDKGKISPFTVLSMPNLKNKDHLRVATNWSEQIKIKPLKNISIPIKNKLTIGYLSADFRNHPLYYLILDILKNHNKEFFRIKLFYSGPDESSIEHEAFKKLDCQFINLSTKNDARCAQLIRDEEVDVLVDLSGFTQNSRSFIAAYKPARYHINWLGFAGSMGFHYQKPLFDFILADKYIIPDGKINDYAEKVLYLPHCYQPNIANRPKLIPKTKIDYGFNDNAFIYASFSQPIKITKDQFHIWMKLLKNSPSADLWLLESNNLYKENLWLHAKRNGIEENRVKFAPKVSIEEHINRHQIIDLFLDTFPYNAHTSTSDAIWAECPVLTLSGQTFASRVAGSILKEINCEELITNDGDEYYDKALKLYKNPKELLRIKQKIVTGKNNSILFKPNIFTANLEKIYRDLFTS
jgi:predicted O-linked N-acetylglucosamine transferase (SPINDLY family)